MNGSRSPRLSIYKINCPTYINCKKDLFQLLTLIDFIFYDYYYVTPFKGNAKYRSNEKLTNYASLQNIFFLKLFLCVAIVLEIRGMSRK